jgi:pSer/pThr/pTyr-binding forkhead associated (FHA) protein
MEVRLVVTNEKASAKQVRLGPETVIGRSSDCNLRIASGQVSRQHCIIRVEESRVLVRDLGSANGTEIDGVTIPPEIDIPVAPGSTLVVGPLKFVFEFTPDPPKEVTGEDDLQSTTQDIPPIPTDRSHQVDDEDTKDYGPSLSRQQRSSGVLDEPDSGQLDFSEGQPTSPVAVVGGDPGIPPEGSSLVSAEETIFDRNLAGRASDEGQSPPGASQPLETGTDWMPDGTLADRHQSAATGISPPDGPPGPIGQTGSEPNDEAPNDIDACDPETNLPRKGWKVFDFLQRGRKPDSSASEKSSEPAVGTPATGAPLPPVDPTAPSATDDDPTLREFFKNFEP